MIFISGLIISKYIISRCNKYNYEVTNLKLQKILYILFGSYYAEYNKSLFNDSFVAWKLGPAIEDIYYRFSPYFADPIHISEDIELNLPTEEEDFINWVIYVFGAKNTWELTAICKNTTPWLEAFSEGKGTKIDRYQIYLYFKSVFQIKNHT